jgi:radixin
MKQEEVLRIQEEVQAKDDETRRLQEEVEAARKRQEEVANALIIATTTPANQFVTDHDDDDELVPNGHSHDLEGGEYPDPVDGRSTHAEKNERLQSQLKMLKQELGKH